jgi:hypothetical protein
MSHWPCEDPDARAALLQVVLLEDRTAIMHLSVNSTKLAPVFGKSG